VQCVHYHRAVATGLAGLTAAGPISTTVGQFDLT